MRGDQLARKRGISRAIEARPNGLTVTEIAQREETGIRTVYRDLEALQAAGFPVYTEKVDHANRWAFIDKCKFKIPPPFPVSHLISLYFCSDLIWVLRRTFSHDSIQSLFSPQTLSNLDQIQSVFHLAIKPYKDYAQFRGNGYNGSSL